MTKKTNSLASVVVEQRGHAEDQGSKRRNCLCRTINPIWLALVNDQLNFGVDSSKH